MDLFIKKFKSTIKKYDKKNIKVLFSGREKPLSDEVIKSMREMEEKTKNNTGGIVNFCLNYGGHSEIIDAIKKIKADNIEDLTEEEFGKYLYNDLPMVDLMIRTGGEMRISNFLLWQLSYAELYFTKVYFPDFNNDEFDKAVIEYSRRDRRFGGINYDKKSN